MSGMEDGWKKSALHITWKPAEWLMDKVYNITERHMDMDFFVVKGKAWSSLTSLGLYLFVVHIE